MIIVWRRWGIIAFAFIGLGMALGFLVFHSLMGGVDGAAGQMGMEAGLGLLLSGALLWVFNHFMIGKVIDKPKQAYVQQQLQQPIVHENGAEQWFTWVEARNPATGELITNQPVSSMFFIPLRFWSYIIAGLGVVIFIINVFAAFNESTVSA